REIEMKKNLSTIIAAVIVPRCSCCRLMRAPGSKSAPTPRGNTNYKRKRHLWMAASRGALAPAGLKRSSTTGWGFPTDPTAIDARQKDHVIDFPRGKYSGQRLGDPPASEVEHFIWCPACGGWIDCRDLACEFEHEGPLPHPAQDRPQ